jgi:hypothetical protein
MKIDFRVNGVERSVEGLSTDSSHPLQGLAAHCSFNSYAAVVASASKAKDGAVEQSNFAGVNLIRMATAPKKIKVDIILTGNHPGGVGEPRVPPAASAVSSAVADAIFALTGHRIREFG